MLAALAGCVKYTEPVVEEPQRTPEEQAFEDVWQASLETLRDHRFTIAYSDRRAGRIVTEPMVARQWFEFWRTDAVTSYELALSALHRILYLAVVDIVPDPAAPGRFVARSRVYVGRSEGQPSQLTSAAQVTMVYAGGKALLGYEEYEGDEAQAQLDAAREATAPREGAPARIPPTQGEGSDLDAPPAPPVVPVPPLFLPATDTDMNLEEVAVLGRSVDFEARINQAIRRRAGQQAP